MRMIWLFGVLFWAIGLAFEDERREGGQCIAWRFGPCFDGFGLVFGELRDICMGVVCLLFYPTLSWSLWLGAKEGGGLEVKWC